MNGVTFGVYSFVMKQWGYRPEEMEHDTIENLQKRVGSGVCDAVHKLPNPWKEQQENKRLSTLCTDGPNIITIQEPLVSSISYTRMYPEQMLWAMKEDPTREEEPNVWRK
jgi:hypothetical protein